MPRAGRTRTSRIWERFRRQSLRRDSTSTTAVQIVGESVFNYGPPFKSHGFLWNGSWMKDLGTSFGRRDEHRELHQQHWSDRGAIGWQQHQGHWHAVLWNTSQKIQDLGVLVGGNYSIAFR